MTGVKPDDSCASSFEALKSKKESRYIIYTITADGKHISMTSKAPPVGSCEEDFTKFSALLKGEYASKCCYAVFDFDWTAEDGHDAQKIMFVLWSPEGAKVKDKMMTTGSKDALKRALVGVGQDFQATDASEITYEACLEKAKSAVRLHLYTIFAVIIYVWYNWLMFCSLRVAEPLTHICESSKQDNETTLG